MSKRSGGIIGCKDQASSWHLIGFQNGSNIGLTVSYRGEAHRYTVHLHSSPCKDTRQNKDKRHDGPRLQIVTLGLGWDYCISGFLRSPQVQPQPCLPLFPLSSLVQSTRVKNLQPPSHTALCQTPGSSPAVLQSPVMPNTRRSFATQCSVSIISSSPQAHVVPFASSPDMTLLDNLWSLMRSNVLDRKNVIVRTVASIL